jgi:hypothetical protein
MRHGVLLADEELAVVFGLRSIEVAAVIVVLVSGKVQLAGIGIVSHSTGVHWASSWWTWHRQT